jgi:hypothetical protein
MPRLVSGSTVVKSHGNLPKKIEEYVGRVNTGDHAATKAAICRSARARQ